MMQDKAEMSPSLTGEKLGWGNDQKNSKCDIANE